MLQPNIIQARTFKRNQLYEAVISGEILNKIKLKEIIPVIKTD